VEIVNRKSKKPNVLERAWQWLAAPFRKFDGIELPPDGRSSVESIPGQFIPGGIGSIIPPFSFETLLTLKKLWMTNPDFSQHVKNIKSLGNTSHSLTVDAASDSVAEAALARINESAARIYANGAGVDGLINAYFDQVSVFGAISSEDVVDFAGRRVDQVVLVPVEQIRFRYINGRYVPYQMPLNLYGIEKAFQQKSFLGLIELNPETYKYYPLQTMQNSPYALPPALAALDVLMGPQADVFESLAYIVNKFGIAGLVSVNVKPPTKKSGETDPELYVRAQKYLKNVRDVLEGSFNKGLLVTYNDQKIDHSNITSDARGASEIIQFVEELGFSGMGSMPFMHGRNYTTTETFANVIFNVIIAQAENFQRLAKRRMESTDRLDLRLAGIQIDSLAMIFDRVESRDDFKKAQGEALRQTATYERAHMGTISADDAAQELGYEAAFDPSMINGILPTVLKEASANQWAKRPGFSAKFRFDRPGQRYRFVPPRIEIVSVEAGSDLARVLPFEKKIAAVA
jgi:hypothetical protein